MSKSICGYAEWPRIVSNIGTVLNIVWPALNIKWNPDQSEWFILHLIKMKLIILRKIVSDNCLIKSPDNIIIRYNDVVGIMKKSEKRV